MVTEDSRTAPEHVSPLRTDFHSVSLGLCLFPTARHPGFEEEALMQSPGYQGFLIGDANGPTLRYTHCHGSTEKATYRNATREGTANMEKYVDPRKERSRLWHTIQSIKTKMFSLNSCRRLSPHRFLEGHKDTKDTTAF